LTPGNHTVQVRAHDYRGATSDYAALVFTEPATSTALTNFVWSPAPARLGSVVSTKADLSWSLPASVFAQPGSGLLTGYPLTFALGSQRFAGTAGALVSQTVQAGP